MSTWRAYHGALVDCDVLHQSLSHAPPSAVVAAAVVPLPSTSAVKGGGGGPAFRAALHLVEGRYMMAGRRERESQGVVICARASLLVTGGDPVYAVRDLQGCCHPCPGHVTAETIDAMAHKAPTSSRTS